MLYLMFLDINNQHAGSLDSVLGGDRCFEEKYSGGEEWGVTAGAPSVSPQSHGDTRDEAPC